MDLEYFVCQVNDELDGAMDYVKKAMEIKPMAPTWTPMLVEMATQELAHAEHLYRMAQDYYSKISASYGTDIPKCLSDLYSQMNENYTEKTAKVKVMMSLIK